MVRAPFRLINKKDFLLRANMKLNSRVDCRRISPSLGGPHRTIRSIEPKSERSDVKRVLSLFPTLSVLTPSVTACEGPQIKEKQVGKYSRLHLEQAGRPVNFS